MKISQKQAQLLAKKVVDRLKAQKKIKVSDLTKAKIVAFVEKHQELSDAKDAATEAMNKHDNTLCRIIGNIRGVYAYHSVSKIIEKVEEKLIPSEEEVADEIILNAMFSDAESLEKFLETIAKKYEKKLQNKIVTN